MKSILGKPFRVESQGWTLITKSKFVIAKLNLRLGVEESQVEFSKVGESKVDFSNQRSTLIVEPILRLGLKYSEVDFPLIGDP